MAKFRIPCATCEGGFHEVDEADLKKFTAGIHNPTQELEKVVVKEVKVDNPELKTKVEQLEASLAKEKAEIPVSRVLEHWDKVVLPHIEECKDCKPLFEEKVVKPITEKAREGYIIKPPEPEPPEKPTKGKWMAKEIETRRVRSPLGRHALEDEFNKLYPEEAE